MNTCGPRSSHPIFGTHTELAGRAWEDNRERLCNPARTARSRQPPLRTGHNRGRQATLPPVALATGWRASTRPARDHSIRVDPTVLLPVNVLAALPTRDRRRIPAISAGPARSLPRGC
jgi:hypothetical protein